MNFSDFICTFVAIMSVSHLFFPLTKVSEFPDMGKCSISILYLGTCFLLNGYYLRISGLTEINSVGTGAFCCAEQAHLMYGKVAVVMAAFHQIQLVRITVARRIFKVTTNPIACNFIWSVSRASNGGRGIRLPLLIVEWLTERAPACRKRISGTSRNCCDF